MFAEIIFQYTFFYTGLQQSYIEKIRRMNHKMALQNIYIEIYLRNVESS